MTVTTLTFPTIYQCGFCNAYHTGVCPQIEEIEYHENGMIKRVKLRGTLTWNSAPWKVTCAVQS